MAAYTTVDDPEAYFQTVLYTGNGSNDLSITLPGDTDMQPDVVWIKQRDSRDHFLFDSVRGVTKYFATNTNAAEDTLADGLTDFNSDGFTIDDGIGINENADAHVAWCWKESATAGFDIVAYTGTGSARTVSHSLSAVPHCIIVKERSEARDWIIYHHKNTSAPETDFLYLNTTAATADDIGFMNDTAPTTGVFTANTFSEVNKASQTYVSYIFSEKQGFSKFGEYEGNGNADGTFIYTGFRPAFVMVKPIDATDNWVIVDNKRLGFNSATSPYIVYANKSFAETTDTEILDLVSNGFKITSSGNTVNRTSTFIYMAFAEAPFVNSNGVPCNAR